MNKKAQNVRNMNIMNKKTQNARNMNIMNKKVQDAQNMNNEVKEKKNRVYKIKVNRLLRTMCSIFLNNYHLSL